MKGGAGARRAAEGQSQSPPWRERAEVSERFWLAASLVVMAVAALLRLYVLELKPMHHDEAVNGFFLTGLFKDGRYAYDPTNYHGPTIYYFALPAVYAFGLKTFAVRLVPVFFGMGLVWLALCLRRRIGPLGALAAAALLAVSPGAVFYSRYFIHETMFLFFALGAVVALLHFHDTGRADYLLLASAALALHFATKETAFMTVVVLALAALIAWWYAGYMHARRHPFDWRDGGGANGSGLAEFVRRVGGSERLWLLLLVALVLFVAVNVLFYSSFFSNGKGVWDAFEALKVWTKTGTSTFHEKPAHTYLKWLLQEEAPLLFLGAVGAALALWSGRNRFAVFAGAWAFGTLAAYSLVPYKTPWLALNFTVPLAVAGGYAVQELVDTLGPQGSRTERRGAAAILLVALCALALGVWRITFVSAGVESLFKEQGVLATLVVAAFVVGWCVWWLYRGAGGGGVWRRRAPALALAALALGVCAYQAWVVSFRQYDNDEYPYVYAQTRREFLSLVGEVDGLAARAGTGTDTRIATTSPGPGSDSYWPLPWYLNDYRSVGYHAQLPSDAAQISIIIGNAQQDAQLRTTLGATHRKVGTTYPLRPGVDLVLYARRELPAR